MYRVPELRQLSDEHHRGLVLARKALNTREEDKDSLWAYCRETFENELEPHFLVEEQAMFPALEKHGLLDLLHQLEDEHTALRELISRQSPISLQLLKDFGTRLKAHIRFEERQVFETIQQVFNPSELKAIEEASRTSRM